MNRRLKTSNVGGAVVELISNHTIRYDRPRWFALENWQATCQFNL